MGFSRDWLELTTTSVYSGIARSDPSSDHIASDNEGEVGQVTFGKHRPSGADHEERPPELVGLAAGDFLPADGPCHPAMLWAMVGATTFAGLLGMWLLQGRIRERRETPK